MGMRERVEQLRGTLLVESAFGEGTTLMVAIPVTSYKRGSGSVETAATSPPSRGETL